ncbi:hypothetical protein QYF36_008261 [Acer negundo]|nr:hypothetical protein QYF36_008261 [Acer negundo]
MTILTQIYGENRCPILLLVLAESRAQKYQLIHWSLFGALKQLPLIAETRYNTHKFEPRQEKSERKGIRCYECGGIGHIALDCGNLKYKKGKVMAATWSGSYYSNKGDESSDDEDKVDNFISFAFSHKSKRSSGEEEESQRENESSEDDSSSNSTKGNVENMDVHDYIVKCESSMMKNKRKLRILEEENLEISTHNDHLSEQVERAKKIEDKLRKELDVSRRNEEGLKKA